MRLTISHLSRQQEGRPLERNSKVANHLLLSPTLMWRYIGRAVTDGEFGVLQSKLNLFQMAPLGPHKPPWGDLRAATVAYRQFKHSTIAPHFYQLFKQKPSHQASKSFKMNKKWNILSITKLFSQESKLIWNQNVYPRIKHLWVCFILFWFFFFTLFVCICCMFVLIFSRWVLEAFCLGRFCLQMVDVGRVSTQIGLAAMPSVLSFVFENAQCTAVEKSL